MTGLRELLRLVLRRDRWRLPVWVIAIAGLTAVSGQGMVSTFGTASAIDSYANSIESSPAAIALTGPPVGLHSMGGVVINKVSAIALIGVALMAIFEIVRHTRAEEEEGRTELLRSTVVGRHAPLVAALVVTALASVLVGVGVALALSSAQVPPSAAWVYGAGITMLGVSFSTITAVLAQLFTHGRTVIGAGLAVLGLSYVVRGIGDVQGSWLVWLSPVGWSQATHPMAGDRWWPLLVPLVVSAILVVAAWALVERRDVGAGLVAERPGRPGAAASLSGPVGLAWRLQRGSTIGWAVGLFALAATIGSLSKQIQSMANDNPTLDKYLQTSGQGGLVDAFFSTMMLILALLTCTFAVQSALRTRGEEAAGRLEPLLATGLSRTRWLLGSLCVTAVATVVLLLLAGFGLGLAYGITVSDASQPFRYALLELIYAPAALLVAGVGVALVGWRPRWAIAVWAYAAMCLVLGWLGGLLNAPQWVENLSPFTHTPSVPVDPVTLAAPAAIVVVAAALTYAGLAGLRRRDIVTE